MCINDTKCTICGAGRGGGSFRKFRKYPTLMASGGIRIPPWYPCVLIGVGETSLLVAFWRTSQKNCIVHFYADKSKPYFRLQYQSGFYKKPFLFAALGRKSPKKAAQPFFETSSKCQNGKFLNPRDEEGVGKPNLPADFSSVRGLTTRRRIRLGNSRYPTLDSPARSRRRD